MNDKFSRKIFCDGMRDGFPIALGYFAVSFSLGIAARHAGFTPMQGIPGQPVKQCFRRRICSFHAGSGTGNLSGSGDHYTDRQCTVPAHELCPGTEILSRHSLFHRLIIAYDVTDELFGITIARPGILNPYYTYGAILLAAPAWAGGTACGIIAGNALPLRAVSALSVALYGMFLAIIIPPARKSKIVAALVAISFALSFVCNYLPGVSSLSEGTRTILLTVIISGAAAILFPVKQDAEEAAPAKANDSVQKGDNVNE